MNSVPDKWHDLSAQAALDALQAKSIGLSAAEAAARLEAHGPNRQPEPPRRSMLLRFLLQFHNVLIYVLLGSALITVALGHLLDILVILAVVVANAVIGFAQEGKAEKAMDAVRRMLALKASVMRDGERRTEDVGSLVPGDMVLLEVGNRIPADVRLLQAKGLQIQDR